MSQLSGRLHTIGTIEIEVDTREPWEAVPVHLERHPGVHLTRKWQQYGDFRVASQVVVERKTANDFATSLTQGRLLLQVAGLARDSSRPVLIVEGSLADLRSEIDPAAVRGALVSISVAWQVPVLHTRDPEDTADMLHLIGRQATTLSNGRWVRAGRPRKDDSNAGYVLQGLPGIGPELARRLLDRFGSVRGVSCANVRQLVEVRGVSLSGAVRIRQCLQDYPYDHE